MNAEQKRIVRHAVVREVRYEPDGSVAISGATRDGRIKTAWMNGEDFKNAFPGGLTTGEMIAVEKNKHGKILQISSTRWYRASQKRPQNHPVHNALVHEVYYEDDGSVGIIVNGRKGFFTTIWMSGDDFKRAFPDGLIIGEVLAVDIHSIEISPMKWYKAYPVNPSTIKIKKPTERPYNYRDDYP